MLDSQHILITALLPPAVKEFPGQCEANVTRLCGNFHARGQEFYSRWGSQVGSIYLGGQKVAVKKHGFVATKANDYWRLTSSFKTRNSSASRFSRRGCVRSPSLTM